MIRLSEDHVAELDHATSHLRAQLGVGVGDEVPDQSLLTSAQAKDFPLKPGGFGATLLRTVREELIDGRGIVLLSKVPIGRYSTSELACLCVGLGSHLGLLMPQSFELKDVLGSVAPAPGELGARGYRNSKEQQLHTDSTIDFVGMFCVRPAQAGGISRYSSATAAYNEMARLQPKLLAPLFRGFQRSLAETRSFLQPEGVPNVTPNKIPVLTWGPRVFGRNGGNPLLLGASGPAAAVPRQPPETASESDSTMPPHPGACVNVDFLRLFIDEAAFELATGQEVRHTVTDLPDEFRTREGVHPPGDQASLDLFQGCLDANRVELRMEPGEMVLFNNRRVLHARSGFDDPNRLLYRLWIAADDLPEKTSSKM